MKKSLPHHLRALIAPALLLIPTLTSAAVDVTIDHGERFQTWRGSGTCLVSWVGTMVDLYKTDNFQRIYFEEMGMNLMRAELWPDVHPEVENVEDISYENFDIRSSNLGNYRAGVFVDFAKSVSQKYPGQFAVIGTVWSPPGWMKLSGKAEDGDQNPTMNKLRPDRYEHFAKWLLEWVKLYESHGVDVLAMSPQNEPLFNQYFNSCYYDQATYAKVFKAVVDRFEQEGYGHILLFGPEHMTQAVFDNVKYVLELKKQEGAFEGLTALASHGYTDGVAADTNPDSASAFWDDVVQRWAPGKEFWVTEGGTGGHSYSDSIDTMAAMLHHGLVDGNVSLWAPWQVSENARSTHNLMQMAQHTPKSQAARHYFGFLKAGAQRISATPSGEDGSTVNVAAFAHDENGTMTVMLLNRTQSQQTVNLEVLHEPGFSAWEVTQTTSEVSAMLPSGDLDFDGTSSSIDLPARSITTLVAREVNFFIPVVFSEGWAVHEVMGWVYGLEGDPRFGYTLNLGWIFRLDEDWVYSTHLGSLYAAAVGDDARWIYQAGTAKWFFTTDALGDWHWSMSDAAWVRASEGLAPPQG